MNKVKTVYIVNLIHLMLIETVYMLAMVFYIFFWRVLVNLEHIQQETSYLYKSVMFVFW